MSTVTGARSLIEYRAAMVFPSRSWTNRASEPTQLPSPRWFEISRAGDANSSAAKRVRDQGQPIGKFLRRENRRQTIDRLFRVPDVSGPLSMLILTNEEQARFDGTCSRILESVDRTGGCDVLRNLNSRVAFQWWVKSLSGPPVNQCVKTKRRREFSAPAAQCSV